MNRKIVKIDKNTWRIEEDVVRFFLLTGSERALLIDSGKVSPDAKSVAESLTGLPVVLLNSHGDRDHISGNGAFAQFYMHQADYEAFQLAEAFPHSKVIPVHDKEIIDLGDRPLEIIETPGHTFGSIAVLDRVNRVLYSGDTVQDGHIYMFGKGRDPDAFAAALEKLIAFRERYDSIYPSHGTPVLPSEYAERVKMAWENVCSGTAEAYPKKVNDRIIRCFEADGCGFYCDPRYNSKRR